MGTLQCIANKRFQCVAGHFEQGQAVDLPHSLASILIDLGLLSLATADGVASALDTAADVVDAVGKVADTVGQVLDAVETVQEVLHIGARKPRRGVK